MQRSVRIQEQQLLFLAERARQEVAKSKSGLCYSGVMSKRSGDSGKWQQRWFLLHQNLLFYFDNISSSRPAGAIFLEGSYCDRAIVSSPRHKEKDGGDNQQHCFVISYRKEGLKQYEFSTDSEASCSAWVDAITQASFNKILQQKEELEQKHLHLLHIVESEKTSKWQLRQQCDDQATEITKLRTELRTLKRHERSSSGGSTKFHVSDFHPRFVADHSDEAAQQLASTNPDLDDLKKIQKVQSFFRGWLCRRRWKQIVEEYIRSPHAENMRKRNSLVFAMVECEQEYVQQIQMLVTCFFRPLKMAASSKNPPISHEDVNSIFLNSETIFFLHQIFMKGLMARMENWPTLVLGDLFDMLLPMLSIYQEYVRNHHYSLQVLAECKQQAEFAALLRRLEEKVQVQGRSLEQFLTYPMNQIPRYIVTLHELLAHTPHDHVERKSLEYAKNRLEELSRIMHDEVSETENIRKNLGIERMICEGCDILLDVNQVFVRQGTLVHVLKDGSKSARGSRFTRSIGTSDKSEVVRQCFLFTNHLIITSRSTTNGKLHLAKTVGKIALHEVTLIEDTCEMNDEEDQGANTNGHTDASHMTGKSSHVDYYQNRDFKIIIDQKPVPLTVHLVAATEEEKVAWTADILQCLENLRCSDLLNAALNEASSVTMPNSIKNDPKLFRDDIDIRFSRSLNSCKVPQIRYATLERLIERLTDLRFLSVDFLNTFLLTYRIFTNSMFVLHALIKVYQSAETLTIEEISRGEVSRQHAGSVCYSIDHGDGRDVAESGADRRISTVSAPPLEGDDVGAMQRNPHWRWSFRKYEEQQRGSVRIRKLRPDTIPSPIPASPCSSTDHQDSVDEPQEEASDTSSPKVQRSKPPADAKHLVVPGKQFLLPAVTPVQLVQQPQSTTGAQVNGTASTEKRASVSSVGDPKAPSKPGETDSDSEIFYLDSVSSRSTRPVRTIQIPPPLQILQSAQVSRGPATGPGSFSTLPSQQNKFNKLAPRRDIKRPYSPMDIASVLTSPNLARKRESNVSDYTGLSLSPRNSLRQPDIIPKGSQPGKRGSTTSDYSDYLSPRNSMLSSCDPRIPVQPSKRGSNVSDVSGYASSYRSSVQFSEASRNSLFASGDPNAPNSGKVGAVVTSSRRSGRRCSSAIAAAAFAVATAASANPPDMFDEEEEEEASRARRSSIICAAATMRVLNVMRHWVSKQRQDFETDLKLREAAVKFLQDVVCDFNLIPAEQKLAGQILRTLTTGGDEPSFAQRHAELERILTPPQGSTRDNTYSALEIAEQMTLLDHKIFMAIRSEEFLCMAWMKEDKGEKAPNILLITKRFNETSRLVVSEIIGCATVTERISVIEKWTAVADICRVLHNYNGVLQICAALVNSSVYRLKRTWQKLSKTTKLTIDKLQTLVASDGRFKNMREALHRCDPPCVPYLGMYLTDLSFIEEGTPNYAENGMINFSKMRMIAHVVQEIKLYQQSPYKIQHSPRVTAYLLDATRLMAEDELYRRSLMIEPRTARMSVDIPTGPAPTAPSGPVTPQPARGGREAKLQTQTSFPG